MGYSNYLERKRSLTDREWELVIDAVSIVFVKWYNTFAKYAFGNVFETADYCSEDYQIVHKILQANIDDVNKARLLRDYFAITRIIYCGFHDDLRGEWLKVPQTEEGLYCDNDKLFDFVKTNRNEISDPLVVSVYSAFEYVLPEICEFRSDGMNQDGSEDTELEVGRRFFRNECQPAIQVLKLAWLANNRKQKKSRENNDDN